MTDVVALAKKIVPDRWHPLAQRIRLAVHRTTPRYRAWRYEKWPVLQCQIVYNKLGGYCMPHSSADRVASQLLLRGHVYEPDTIEYIARHAKSGDVIHAGAFFGDFLPAISRACAPSCKIWAFEPDPENYRCALITILINDLRNVRLINAALGEKGGTCSLVTSDADGRALGELSYVAADQGSSPDRGNTVTTQIVSIDEVVPHDSVISVLHLDIEGYETNALAGALATIRRNRPLIIVETLPPTEWLAEFLFPLGYRIDGHLHKQNTVLVPTLSAAAAAE